MTAALHINIPNASLADVAQRYHVRELRLFGSVVRDDFRPESDIDVLVEFEPDAQVGLFVFFALRDELRELFGREVDLISKGGLHRLIRDDVLADSEIVYAV